MSTKIKASCRQVLTNASGSYHLFSLPRYAQEAGVMLEKLPFSIRILLESCLRHQGDGGYDAHQLESLAAWQPQSTWERPAVAFLPARILMQDFTGLPVINDFSALRAFLQRAGKDPQIANPRIPADLVIDHSVPWKPMAALRRSVSTKSVNSSSIWNATNS